MAVLTLEQHDRLPWACLKAAVDAERFFFDFGHEVLITFNTRAAGRADLHEGQFAAIRGMLLEEPLDAAKPLGNAFGVIDAVNPDPHVRGLDAQVTE